MYECEVLTSWLVVVDTSSRIPSIKLWGCLKKIYQEIQSKETVFYCYYLAISRVLCVLHCELLLLRFRVSLITHCLYYSPWCYRFIIPGRSVKVSLLNTPIEISENHQLSRFRHLESSFSFLVTSVFSQIEEFVIGNSVQESSFFKFHVRSSDSFWSPLKAQ